MPEVPLKDIALGVMGAAAAMAAVLLVFVTFLVSRADALPSPTPDKVVKRYIRKAKCGMIPLLLQMFALGSAYWWLFHMDSCRWLLAWKYGFLAALATFLLYAVWVSWML